MNTIFTENPATDQKEISFKTRSLFIFVGVIYGVVMCVWSFLTLGMGEGNIILLGILSSPLSQLLTSSKDDSTIGMLFLTIPFLWSFFGILQAFIDYKAARIAFLVLTIVHCLGIQRMFSRMGNLSKTELYDNLDKTEILFCLVVGLIIYLSAQILMLHRFRVFRKKVWF